MGVWKSGGTVLRWKVCVGWQVETPELELELEGDGHGQRGEESSWNGDCEEGSEATWGMAGGAFCRAERQWKEATQKDPK